MGSVLSNVFTSVLNMSITAAYVALAVILIRLLLKRAPKAVSYALWLVVLFRLVCPVSFSSPVSLMRLGNVAPTVQQDGSVTYIQSPMPAYHAPAVSTVAAAPAGTASNIIPANAAATNPLETLLYIAAAVWAAGAAVMLILSVISHIKLKRTINDATLLYGNVYETDAIQSPFVLGVFRPRIYLPAGMEKNDLEYVLRHERMHIQRRDNVIKPLAYAVLCLHWFNPLVWIAFHLMCADMELSCDERVLRGMEERDKAGYSEALLKLSTNRRLLAGSPLAFGETSVKSRIKNALKFRKPVFWIVAIAALAAVAVGVCLIANPSGAVSAGADKLYGDYKFDKQVYMNPLSSFLAFDGYEQYYTLSNDTLAITEASGEQKSIPVTYDRKDVSEQDFAASFMSFGDANIGGVPDISQYKQRYQYTLRKPADHVTGYRLYIMDEEIWFAELHYNDKLNGPGNEHIWSIYSIARYGGELPKPQNTAMTQDPATAPSPSVAPASTAEITTQLSEAALELNIGGQCIHGLSITDKAQLQIIDDAVANALLKSAAWEAVDIDTLQDYIKISGVTTGLKEVGDYYVFDKDGKHCMQAGENGMYSILNDEAYGPLLELALGYYLPGAPVISSGDYVYPSDTPAVSSGNNTIHEFVNTVWTEKNGTRTDFVRLTPQQVAGYIQYINLGSDPGSWSFGGDVTGKYTLYDSDFNIVMMASWPDGSRAYLPLDSIQPGMYIVEMETSSVSADGAKEGKQYFFGVIISGTMTAAKGENSQTTAPTETGNGALPVDVEISLYIGGDSDCDVPIKDEAVLQLAQDVVTEHMSSEAREGVKINTLDSYLVLNGQFAGLAGPESFYIFEKDGKYCIQESAQGRYSIIGETDYYVLIDTALGYGSAGTMTIATGDNSVYALEHIISTDAAALHGGDPRLKPEQVAKYLQYLSIDAGKEMLTPFTPYLNGEKVYGTYKLYDSDFNEIPVTQPSGLEPQTYLFANTPGPGRYIVELEATSNIGNMEYKSQYFFGVVLSEKE